MPQLNSIVLANKRLFPSKVVCIGRNYVEHIAELGNETPQQAVIFIKPNSAISDELCFNDVDEIHYEAELSFLIQQQKITAVAIGLDLTKRAIQSQLKAKGLPWERAKVFDKAAVFSEFIAIDANNDNLQSLSMQLWINDKLIQQANYQLMMLKPQQVLQAMQEFISIVDNDIIMTGTPKGVGKIYRGDKFVGKVFLADNLIIEHEWIVV